MPPPAPASPPPDPSVPAAPPGRTGVVLTTRRRWAFRLVTLALATGAGLAVLEAGLRWQAGAIRRSEALDPGLIQPDAELGWKLTPHWTGQHRHRDFTARYSTNEFGSRADAPPPQAAQARRTTFVLGDSFAFGLGVDDDQTFVHLLNERAGASRRFTNVSVPGYSTDQQMLLLERDLWRLKPGHLLLVVYLANDLFDNERAVPLQVGSAKPYFTIEAGQLQLRNVPVPPPTGPRPSGSGLLPVVLGPDPARWPWRTRLEQRSELLRRVNQAWLPDPDLPAEFPTRFASSLQLFGLLLDRIAAHSAAHDTGLTIALLAGRSFTEQPRSLSAQYQEYFRQEIVRQCGEKNLPVIDVAAELQTTRRAAKRTWYFPNDGHLTPEGHRAVAEILARQLRD